jgi:hypothetical protein
VLRLVGAFDGDAEVGGLLLREFRQLHADFFQVQAGDFLVEPLVEPLGQTIYADFLGVSVLPQVESGADLVREAVAHHETWMAFGTTEVHQAAFGEEVEAAATRKIVAVHLRLDVHLGHAFRGVEAVNLNLVVEVAMNTLAVSQHPRARLDA